MNIQVESLVLMDASVYAEGTGNLATLPKAAAYAGVSSHQVLYIKVPLLYWRMILLSKTLHNSVNTMVFWVYEFGILGVSSKEYSITVIR